MVREIRSLFQVSISPFAWTTGNWPWVDGSVSCRWRNIDEWIVYIMGGVAPGSDRTVMSALSTNSHTCIVLFPFSCSLFSFHRSHTNVSDPENVQFLVRPGLLFLLLNHHIMTSLSTPSIVPHTHIVWVSPCWVWIVHLTDWRAALVGSFPLVCHLLALPCASSLSFLYQLVFVALSFKNILRLVHRKPLWPISSLGQAHDT